MSAQALKHDVDAFRSALKNLRDDLTHTSIYWNDQQFRDLSEAVKQLAELSTSVLEAGERCLSSIERFSRVAEEHD